MRERYRDLSRNYDELQSSCLSLLQSYNELRRKLNESLTELDRLTEENRQLQERLKGEIPGWIMADKIAYISDEGFHVMYFSDPSSMHIPQIVHVTARDLLSYPKLDLALQEAEIANLKHLAHPLEMIKLANCEAKAIVEFLSGKQANATEGVTYDFVVNYNETLYSVSMILTWIRPIKS